MSLIHDLSVSVGSGTRGTQLLAPGADSCREAGVVGGCGHGGLLWSLVVSCGLLWSVVV